MQQADIPIAIRTRGKLGTAGDGMVEQALDEPAGELLNGCLLVRVEAPQLPGAAGQLLTADPFGSAAHRPDRCRERGLRLEVHGAGQVA
jgi:hypothetical protein